MIGHLRAPILEWQVKGTLKYQLIREVQSCTRVMAEPGHES